MKCYWSTMSPTHIYWESYFVLYSTTQKCYNKTSVYKVPAGDFSRDVENQIWDSTEYQQKLIKRFACNRAETVQPIRGEEAAGMQRSVTKITQDWESHNEFAHQMCAQSDQRFVCKCQWKGTKLWEFSGALPKVNAAFWARFFSLSISLYLQIHDIYSKN